MRRLEGLGETPLEQRSRSSNRRCRGVVWGGGGEWRLSEGGEEEGEERGNDVVGRRSNRLLLRRRSRDVASGQSRECTACRAGMPGVHLYE